MVIKTLRDELLTLHDLAVTTPPDYATKISQEHQRLCKRIIDLLDAQSRTPTPYPFDASDDKITDTPLNVCDLSDLTPSGRVGSIGALLEIRKWLAIIRQTMEVKTENWMGSEDSLFYKKVIHRLSEWLFNSEDVVYRTMICQCLQNVLWTVLWKMDLQVWCDGLEKCDEFVAFIDFPITPEWFIRNLSKKFSESYRRPVPTSVKNLDEWYSAVVQLCQNCKVFWPMQGGLAVLSMMQRDVLEKTSSRAVAYLEMMDHMASGRFCYHWLLNSLPDTSVTGMLTYWDLGSPTLSLWWDNVFMRMLSRALKYAWSIGSDEIHKLKDQFLPRVTLVLNRLGLRIPVTMTKQLSIPQDVETDRLSADLTFLTKPNGGRSNKNSIITKAAAYILVYLLTPKNSAQYDTEVWDLVADIMTILEPYANPSTGISQKVDLSIANFISSFIQVYVKRVGRERSWLKEKSSALALGPLEDRCIFSLCFPLCTQGIFKKSQDVGTKYDLILSHLCLLSPKEVLNWLANRLRGLDIKAEPLQLISLLRISARLSRQMALHKPDLVLDLFGMVELSMDVSEQLRAMSLLSCFLSLSTFIPLTDSGDTEGMTEELLEGEWKRLLPMYGAKTAENKHLFNRPFTNIRNYPVARLEDEKQNNPERLTNAAPDAEDDEYGSATLSGYQSVDELRMLFEYRAMIIQGLPYFVEAFVDRLLKSLDRMGTGKEDALDENLANTLQSLMYSMINDMSTALVARLNEAFWAWALKLPRGSVTKVVCAIAGGLGSSSKLDMLAIALPKVKLALFGTQSKPWTEWALSASPAYVDWTISVLRSSLAIFDRNYLRLHLPELVQLSWFLMHDSNAKVFKAGTALLSTLVEKLLESDVVGWKASVIVSKRPSSVYTHWLEPVYRLKEDGLKSLVEWEMPSDADIDMGIELSTLFFKVLAKLGVFKKEVKPWIEAYRSHKRNASLLLDLTELGVLCDMKMRTDEAHTDEDYPSVFKAIRLMKKQVEGLSMLFVDEEKSRTIFGFPNECRNVGNEIMKFGVEFLENIGHDYMGLDVQVDTMRGSMNDEQVAPNQGIDKVKLCQKILTFTDLLALRCPNALRTSDPIKNLEGWLSFGLWSNPLFQLHKYSNLEFSSSSAFIERVQQAWLYKLMCPGERLKFTAERRWIFVMVLCMTTCMYAQVRVGSQKLLTKLIKSHIRSRDQILGRLIDEWHKCAYDENWFGNEAATDEPNADEPLELLPSITPRDSGSDIGGNNGAKDLEKSHDEVLLSPGGGGGDELSSQGMGADEEDMNKLVRALSGRAGGTKKDKDSAHEYRLHRHMTGLVYVLGDIGMMRRIMSRSEWRDTLVLTLLDALSRPVTQVSLRQRLLALARSSVDCRVDTAGGIEDLEYSPKVADHLSSVKDNQEFLRKLLDKLEGEPGLHWRSQTYGMAMIIVNLTERNLINCPDIVGRIIKCLVVFMNSVASLVTLAGCGLTILMKILLKARKREGESKVQVDDGSMAYLCENADRILSKLNIIHVQISKNKNGNDLLYHLLIDVIRCDRSWPSSMVGKYSMSGSGLSLHCCSLVQTLMQTMYRVLGDEVCLKYLESRILQPIVGQWVKLDKDSPSDEENYCATAEFYAGLFRASRKWKLESMLRMFQLSVPGLLEKIQQGQNAGSNIWLDSARWTIQGIFGGTKMVPRTLADPILDDNFLPNYREYIRGVVNAYVNGKAECNQYLPVNSPPMSNTDNSSGDLETTSLDYRRRILTASTIHYDLCSLDSEEVEWCQRTVFNPVALRHDFKRVRDTCSHGVAQFLLCCSGMALMFKRLGLAPLESVQKCEAAMDYFHNRMLLERVDPLRVSLADYRRQLEEAGAKISPDGDVLEFISLSAVVKMLFTHPARATLWHIGATYLPLGLEARLFNAETDVGQYGRAATDVIINNATLCFAPGAVRNAVEQMVLNDFWCKPLYRKHLLSLIELYIVKHSMTRMAMKDFGELKDKVNRCILEGLCDISLSDYALPSHAVLCSVLNHDQRNALSQDLLATMPSTPAEGATSDETFGNLMALSSLIRSCDNSYIAYWVPMTLTKFARYANHKSSDQCRRVVEKCLQTFFHSYNQDWDRVHKHKFTRRQLDILQQHKGRPVYFS